MEHEKSSGMTLAELLIALGIFSILIIGVLKVVDQSKAIEKHLAAKIDKEEIRQLLLVNIDCRTTFKDAELKGITKNDSVTCGGRSYFSKDKAGAGPYFVYGIADYSIVPYTLDYIPKYLMLYGSDKAGNAVPLMGALETAQPEIVGSGTFMGDWRMRVECSKDEESLIIKIAKWNAKQKSFEKDPITGNELNFENKSSIIFGFGHGSLSTCYDSNFVSTSVARAKINLGWVMSSCSNSGCTPTNTLLPVEVPPGVPINDIFTVVTRECPSNWQLCKSGIKCNSAKGWHLVGCIQAGNRYYDANWIQHSLESYLDLTTNSRVPLSDVKWKYSWDHDLEPDSTFEGCVTDDRDQAMGWRYNGYFADYRERGDVNPLPDYKSEIAITCVKNTDL